MQGLVAALPYRYCAEHDLVVLTDDQDLANKIETWGKLSAAEPSQVYRY